VERRYWRFDWKKVPGGENRLEQFNRVKPVIEDILKIEKEILIVSHGGTIRLILGVLFPQEKLENIHKRYQTGNTCLYEIEINDDKKAKIIIGNCIEHLDN